MQRGLTCGTTIPVPPAAAAPPPPPPPLVCRLSRRSFVPLRALPLQPPASDAPMGRRYTFLLSRLPASPSALRPPPPSLPRRRRRRHRRRRLLFRAPLVFIESKQASWRRPGDRKRGRARSPEPELEPGPELGRRLQPRRRRLPPPCSAPLPPRPPPLRARSPVVRGLKVSGLKVGPDVGPSSVPGLSGRQRTPPPPPSRSLSLAFCSERPERRAQLTVILTVI